VRPIPRAIGGGSRAEDWNARLQGCARVEHGGRFTVASELEEDDRLEQRAASKGLVARRIRLSPKFTRGLERVAEASLSARRDDVRPERLEPQFGLARLLQLAPHAIDRREIVRVEP